jgi:elongation factor P
MDSEDYTSYSLNKETIADEAQFIAEDTQNLQVVVLNDVPVGVDLPGVVELVIVDTAPAMKGSSATSRTKPATLTTGLVVQVPEHISTGDRIRVNVEECKFTGRA